MTTMSQSEYAEYKRASNLLNPINKFPQVLTSQEFTLFTRYAIETSRVATGEIPAFLPSTDCSGVVFCSKLPLPLLPEQLPVPTTTYNKHALTGKSYNAYLNRVKSLNYKGLLINCVPMCNSIPNAKLFSYNGFNDRIQTKTFMVLT